MPINSRMVESNGLPSRGIWLVEKWEAVQTIMPTALVLGGGEGAIIERKGHTYLPSSHD